MMCSEGKPAPVGYTGAPCPLKAYYAAIAERVPVDPVLRRHWGSEAAVWRHFEALKCYGVCDA